MIVIAKMLVSYVTYVHHQHHNTDLYQQLYHPNDDMCVFVNNCVWPPQGLCHHPAHARDHVQQDLRTAYDHPALDSNICADIRCTSSQHQELAVGSEHYCGGANNDYKHDPEVAFPEALTYHIAAINIESANTQFDQLQAYGQHGKQPPDVLILSEHRIATEHQKTAKKKFMDHGWTLHLSSAPRQGGHAHGGIGVATRGGLRYRPQQHQQLQPWYDNGRLITGALQTLAGQHLCELIGIYAPTDAKHHRDEVEQLITALGNWIGPRHRLPILIAGDFNLPLHQQPELSQWVAAGVLQDLLKCYEYPRCATHISGSCLDHALATETLRARCTSAYTDESFVFPTHKGTHVEITAAPQVLDSYHNAQALPTTRLARLYLAQDPEAQGPPASYLAALQHGSIDQAHAHWCKRWEDLLQAACRKTGAEIHGGQLGRGEPSISKALPPIAKTSRTYQLPLPIRQHLHSVNALRALLQDELRHQHTCTWEMLHHLQRQRQHLKHRLWQVHQLEFDPTHEYAPEQALDILQPRLRELQQRHADNMLTRWKSRIRDYGAACRHITQQPFERLDCLQVEENQWTSNVAEMDEVLRDFWEKQSIDKPDDLDMIRDNTRRLVDELVPEQPHIVFDEITGKQITTVIAELKNSSAPGPGCWHPSDLKSLPPCAMQELAMLYVTCEKWQYFPRIFSQSITTNIPKGPGKAKPSEIRPITVFPMLWRIYAKLRARQATQQIAPRLSPNQNGAMPGCSVEDLVVQIKFSIDQLIRHHGHLHGLQVDIMKCFNGLDHDSALYVLQKLGLPPAMAQLWNGQYQRHTTHHRFAGSVIGRPYTPTRGIAQGDPLAVLMANALLSLVPKALEQAAAALPGLGQWWFLDDSTLICHDPSILTQAYDVMQRTFKVLALRVSLPKTVYFTNAPDRHLNLGPHQLQGVTRLEILGADFRIPHGQASVHPDNAHDLPVARNQRRWDQVMPRIHQLRCLPLGPAQKTHLAVACIASVWKYAPIGARPTPQHQHGAQAALQNAVFGTLRREAAAEVIQGHLLPVHFTHLRISIAYALLRLIRRAWIREHFDPMMLETLPQQYTLVDDLRLALRAAGLGLNQTVIYALHTDTQVDLIEPISQSKWLHKLRELCRDLLMGQLARRRPREYQHRQAGVARNPTIQLWRKLRDPHLVSALKRWMAGSLPFKERIWRHHRQPGAPSPYCVWCHHKCHEQCLETIEHIVFDCPYTLEKRDDQLHDLLRHVPRPWLNTGMLPRDHQLPHGYEAHWPRIQRHIIEVIVARERDLTTLEQQQGSPPPRNKYNNGPRYRLIGKQPPTTTCPDLSAKRSNPRQILLAEEDPPGQWHFNEHVVVGLPINSNGQYSHLFCIRCRRSATVQHQHYHQALRTIHKRHPHGCTPSQQRCKVDTSLHHLLPQAHLITTGEGEQEQVHCNNCGSVAPGGKRRGAWMQSHALCFWQDLPPRPPPRNL